MYALGAWRKSLRFKRDETKEALGAMSTVNIVNRRHVGQNYHEHGQT